MDCKKKLWLNYVATQLTVKDKTFGQLLSSKSEQKKTSKIIFNENLTKKNKKTMVHRKFGINKKSKLNFKSGSILILLSKKSLGKKVILLNTTESGLLVVTGPFSINGVSMRRVNPKYTVLSGATLNLEWDLSNFSRNAFTHAIFGLNDEYFTILKTSKHKNSQFRNYKYILSHRIRQNYIDKFLIGLLKKDFFTLAYLRTIKSFLPIR
jgi:hypothetical protein